MGKAMRYFRLFFLVLCASFPSLAKEPEQLTEILPAVIKPQTVPPGSFFKITYQWKAPARLPSAYKVFVHVKDKQGNMVFQADHDPSVGTATPGWIGKVSYEKVVILPSKLPEGEYAIMAGLYDKNGRGPLKAGFGVSNEGNKMFFIGSFKVDHNAPRPQADTEKTPSLNLDGYTMTFNEDFDGPLDVSAWGPGTRWIAHTPWRGDFGDAEFSNPHEGFPFTIENGILRIEARKDENGKWHAGLLSSNDPKGKGFSQQYGYFEARAKLPAGPGVWPAFWLCSSYDRTAKNAGADGAVEIDVFEYYGHSPNDYTATMHVWEPKPHWGHGTTITTRPGEPSTGFHNYGALVEPEWTTMYFDGVEVWKEPTPKEHNKPLMLLLNLALGSGWPIEKTPNPSVMEVDYVRVYSKQ